MSNVILGAEAGADSSTLAALLTDSVAVGGIFDFGYREASVMTNDDWLHDAHGVPQHCLLLAYPRDLDSSAKAAGIQPQDREVILLRVLRETSLPNQSDLTRLRAEDTDRTLTNHFRQDGREGAVADVLTRNLMQQAAFRCRILGTFVEDDRGELVFGKDVDAVYAAGGYKVAKPHGASLQLVVDHVELPMGESAGEQNGDVAPNADLPDTDATMVVGRLRYASSRRREIVARRQSMTTEVEVRVRPKDFVAHKTAVFGMTRAGKSNTMKVLAAAVLLYSHKTGTPVGQLIFDPAGEYAYANKQDGTALSQLGENVRIYRLGATEADRKNNIRPLSLNFFDANQVSGCWSLIESYFQGSTTKYMQNFLASDPTRDPQVAREENDHSAEYKLSAVRAMYFAILLRAGLEAPEGWKFHFPVNQDTCKLIKITGSGWVWLDARQLVEACSTIARAAAGLTAKSTKEQRDAVKLWVSDPNLDGHGDPNIEGLVNMLVPGRSNGYKELQHLKPYHHADSLADFAPAIYADLARGRLVIVDLARGSEQVLQTCAERVINELLSRASKRFHGNLPPRPMQVFLEEAHRLLDRDKFAKGAASSDPYVRLAKESAKYKIGMIYATQEVSSVDEMILSNTANWVCAYMNNASETKKLANYYDLGDFADQILTADDRGFVRLRTDSSPYTLPVQITKFNLEMVNRIRHECGLPATGASTDFAPEIGAERDTYADCPDPDEQFNQSLRSARQRPQAPTADSLFPLDGD